MALSAGFLLWIPQDSDATEGEAALGPIVLDAVAHRLVEHLGTLDMPEGEAATRIEWMPGDREGRIRRNEGWGPLGSAGLIQALGNELLETAQPDTRGLWLSPLAWVRCEKACVAVPLEQTSWIASALDDDVFGELPLVVVLKDDQQNVRDNVYGEGMSGVADARPVFGPDDVLGPSGWNWYVALGDLPGQSRATPLPWLWMIITAVLLLIGGSAYLIVLSRRDKRRAEDQMRFVASASHELRTPLSVIDGAADSLAEGVVKRAEDVREYGELIRSESRRLANLVNNVLQFSSANQRLFNVDMIDVEGWVRTSIAHAADPQDVDLTIAEHLPSIRGNRAGLDSLLVNLIGNAIRYSEDGRATVEVGSILRSGGQLALAVSVSNRVAGRMDADPQEWFEPFRRGRNAAGRPGTGLGLSVARTIAHQHGGDISLRVADDRVRFTVFLPEAANE